MDHTDRDELRRWVMEQTALLDPPSGWRPDAGAALTRFHTRRSVRAKWGWRGWAVALSAAVLAGLVAGFLYPAGKLAAQRLWKMAPVGRVAIIEVRPWPEGVPAPDIHAFRPTLPVPPLPARDVNEAAMRVGFTPRLPGAFVLSTSPRLSTTFPVGAGTTVHTADLELALAKAGISGENVPPAWDGAQLGLRTSGLVIAEWPDAVLVQSLPLTLTAPGGFDFAAYSSTILQILGLAPDEAKRLAERAGTTPPWLAPFARETDWGNRRRMSLEEIALNDGPATMLTERLEDGSLLRMGLFWSVTDRVYLLSGTLDKQLAIGVANAVR